MGSLGGSDNTTQSGGFTNHTNGTATNNPNVPSWLQVPFQNYLQGVANWNQGGNTPPNGLMQSAWFDANNLGPAGNFNSQRAINATNGLLGFNPQTVSPQNAPTRYATNTNANTSLGQTAFTGQGQTLGNTNLQQYMNPFTGNVIDQSMMQLERARQGAINEGQAEATQAGAYGGSRHGVADSLTNREFADSAGNLAANLNAQNFNQAQGAAQFDVGNDLTRRMTNTNALNQMRMFNAANQNNTSQFNAANANNNSQFNADAFNNMVRYNRSNDLQGQMFNSSQGLLGAQFRGNMADQIANLGWGQEANTRQNILAQLGAGAQQWSMSPHNQNLLHMQQLQGLLGMDPSSFIGRTITSNEDSSGTSTGTGSQSHNPGLFDWLQLGANVAGGFMKSDRRVKKDIRYRNTDERGNRWYDFRYLWDDAGAPLRVGVMADEAPPHAVYVDPSDGMLMVDYGAI